MCPATARRRAGQRPRRQPARPPTDQVWKRSRLGCAMLFSTLTCAQGRGGGRAGVAGRPAAPGVRAASAQGAPACTHDDPPAAAQLPSAAPPQATARPAPPSTPQPPQPPHLLQHARLGVLGARLDRHILQALLQARLVHLGGAPAPDDLVDAAARWTGGVGMMSRRPPAESSAAVRGRSGEPCTARHARAPAPGCSTHW